MSESHFPPERRAAAKQWRVSGINHCWAHPDGPTTFLIGEGVDFLGAALAELSRLEAENADLRNNVAGFEHVQDLWNKGMESTCDDRDVLKQEARRLEAAIRRHRDYRGDDRCWQDDEELYRALPEGYTPPAREVAVELQMCERYIACRRNPATEYVSLRREIERLEANNARLRAALAPFAAAAGDLKPTTTDAWPLFDAMGDDDGHGPLSGLTCGHLRAAKAAIDTQTGAPCSAPP